MSNAQAAPQVAMIQLSLFMPPPAAMLMPEVPLPHVFDYVDAPYYDDGELQRDDGEKSRNS